MNTNEEMNVTLGENKTIRYNFLIPAIGVTVDVCITEGHIHAYGSVSVPNPNSAFYDFFIELDIEHYEHRARICHSAYVEVCRSNTTRPRPRRQTSESNSDNQVVYLSIVGMAKESSFVVNGTAGEVYHADIDIITPELPDSKACLLNASVFCVSHIIDYV